MNKLAILLLSLLVTSSYGLGQTVYSFGTFGAYTNPGWVSNSNTSPANRVLNYQPLVGMVSSSDIPAGNRYVNNQITSYTSPNINTTCANASTVTVTFVIDYDLEYTYDWAYFQYSLNGGTTWINPIGASTYSNWSGINLSAYPPLTNWVANNMSNRNGWTNYGTYSVSFTIPSATTTRFRFLFASDASGNYYTSGNTEYDYYFDLYSFDIACNVVMPVTLSSFTGYNNQQKNENALYWQTETEQANDYFIVQWTSTPDSEDWTDLTQVNGAGNSDSPSFYEYRHFDYDRNKINYYRLVQVDNDGTRQVYTDYISIDNRTEKVKNVVKVVNLLGQEVDENYSGIVIFVYDDGTTQKVYNP